jgi:hypothetical protein
MSVAGAGLEGNTGVDFKTFERQDIDKLYENQSKGAFQSIFSDFRQPLILNAISENGMFNQLQYNEALTFYNSITELERKDVEDALKPVIENSIWSGFGDLKIKPKPILTVEVEEKEKPQTEETQQTEEDGTE